MPRPTVGTFTSFNPDNRSTVHSAARSMRVVVLRRPGPRVPQRFMAARREALHTPAVQAFWAHLQGMSPASG
jgi:DNA-binding transcriptional LysR family regulator